MEQMRYRVLVEYFFSIDEEINTSFIAIGGKEKEWAQIKVSL